MLTFLKLGGSLITDKAQPETARHEVIARVANEIATALREQPVLRLLIGHGSGSFGHSVAKQYNTHLGVSGAEAWRGFAKVGVVAARLTYIITEALDAAGVPVFRVSPSASAMCRGGQLIEMAIRPIEQALQVGLVPLVHGDVGMDVAQGGTIISTEAVFDYLAHRLKPARILLVGDYEGVLDQNGQIIPRITPRTLENLRPVLSGSAQVDVTGGMAAKVEAMIALCQTIPDLNIHIFSGREAGMITQALIQTDCPFGTRLSAQES